MRPTLRIAACAALVLVTGCGQKGPLRLPSDAAPAAHAPASAPVPAP